MCSDDLAQLRAIEHVRARALNDAIGVLNTCPLGMAALSLLQTVWRWRGTARGQGRRAGPGPLRVWGAVILWPSLTPLRLMGHWQIDRTGDRGVWASPLAKNPIATGI